MLVNIIGAGNLGKTLGCLLVRHNLVKIGGIYNRTLENSVIAREFIGDGVCFNKIASMPAATVTIIATPDDKICEISMEICRYGNINPGNIFLHCSGVLTSDVIAAVKLKGALVASIHPMKSFADPQLAADNYAGTYCVAEGDIQALQIIEPLFAAFGSIIYKINKEKKSLYHIAGVFGSNYLITLAHNAMQCLKDAGFNDEESFKIIINLMQGSLENIKKLISPIKALTGPIKRGDTSTIIHHLSAISDPKIRLLYSTLGKATIELTMHDIKVKEKLNYSLSIAPPT